MPATVSVIIPAYNSEKFIFETIQSALNQTYSDFELLVIDDGSTDNQKEIIQRFVCQDTRVKYFFKENKGVSAARNFGFSNSQGKFIAFLDADDVWMPTNLALKVDKLEGGNFGLVHSDAVVIDEVSEKTGTQLEGKEGDLLDALLLWESTQIPGPSSILVRREVIEDVGWFDEKLSTSADKDFFIRVAACCRIGRVNEITWQYRTHPLNMHKNIMVMEKDVLLMYEKARNLKLFRNKAFERKCFCAMYLILAASWAGDGHSTRKAMFFVWQAFVINPAVLIKVVQRLTKQWALT